jgi:protein-glutamine gamma-glutamyltransferase
MGKKRPQLNADELAQLKWLLGNLLAPLSAWTILFIEIDAWLHLMLITALAAGGLLFPGWPARVPSWLHRLAFPAILAVFAYDIYTSREPMPALIRLDLMLILYRLTVHRSRREDLQLIVLGLFLVVVAGVLTVSLAFAIQILAFTGCALLFLFVVTLADMQPPSGEGQGAPNWTRVSWRHLARRAAAATDVRLVLFSGASFAGLVAVSALLFLAIPRFEIDSSIFLDRLMSRRTQTGFSDHVRFGDVTAISQDNSLALTVDVTDVNALPAIPYWRMIVLDDYHGHGFSVSAALRASLHQAATRSQVYGLARHHQRDAVWTLYLEPGISRYLPLLGDYRMLHFQEPQTFARDDSSRVLALLRDPPKMIPYRVHGMEHMERWADVTLAQARRHDPSVLSTYLDLSALHAEEQEQLRIFVQQAVMSVEPVNAAEFSRRTINWLAQHHRYSLESSLPRGDGDPLVRWLQSSSPGHCEFFAGSFVLLARAAGIPARMVTGFKGGTWNPYSQSLAVRNANAHAWCEIFDASTDHWVRVDPTPGAEAAAQIAAVAGAAGRQERLIDEGWQARWESMRVFWYRRIVNFDRSTQRQLLTHTRQVMETGATHLRHWLDARAENFVRWVRGPWGLNEFAVAFGTLVAAAAMGLSWRYFGYRWWLKWRSRRARPGGDPVRREAGRWLGRWPDRTGPASPVHAALVRIRFGPKATWADPPSTFRQARREVRRLRRLRPEGPSDGPA